MCFWHNEYYGGKVFKSRRNYKESMRGWIEPSLTFGLNLKKIMVKSALNFKLKDIICWG